MRYSGLIFILLLMTTIMSIGCSGSGNPLIPSMDDIQQPPETEAGTSDPASNSEIYITDTHGDYMTFQAPLAVAQVIIDPKAMKGEIIPARNAKAIGDVFDADLTQFLRINPCYNCLQLGAMNLSVNGNIVVEFKIRHPFTNIATRPDLHVFDVRGITISGGTKVFNQTPVMNTQGVNEDAKGNVGMLVNADGYTSHFDSIAENPLYFGTPRNYAGNINPFKKFYVNPAGGTFDPFNPTGHNVMKVGAGWSSAYYELKVPDVGNIDFVLVVDCAYGHSAVLANRLSPKYYIPWFNRKEPWKLTVEVLSNNLVSGDTDSEALIRTNVCDWQAGMLPTAGYPNSPLNTIPVKSDVKRVTVEIPGVTGTLKIKTVPDSGSGTNDVPYRYDFTVKNELAASGGTYYGIVATRDDIDGTTGPLPVTPGPSGFPFEGPDLRDYSMYQVFQVDVAGAPNQDPIIDVRPYAQTNPVDEQTLVKLIVEAHDPDGDLLDYYWDQLGTPQGIFQDREKSETYWISPNITQNTNFTFTVTIDDNRGGTVMDNFILQVKRVNNPPEITFGPQFEPLIIDEGQFITIDMEVTDVDGDPLTYQWFQVEPASPLGQFDFPNIREPRWLSPAIKNDTVFKLRVIISDNEDAATAQINVPVGAINQAPVGTLIVTKDPPVYFPSQNITFQSSFTDPDGNAITQYEWDFNYDGTFNVDYSSGSSGNLNFNFSSVGIRTVAVRGWDNGDPSLSGIATVNLAIRGLWGANQSINSIAPPALRIGSSSSQKALANNGDRIHVVFEGKSGGNKAILISTSLDGGSTFGSEVSVATLPDTSVLESPSIKTYGDYVWVAWKQDNDVKFARSTNAGSSFESSFSLSPSTANGDHKPSIAYDPIDNELYVVFADRNVSSNGIISLRRSTDEGASFLPMATVVTDNTAPTSDAAIAAVPDGNLYVAWIDTRSHVNGDLFFSKSVDDGQTFNMNRQVNQDFSGAGVQNPSLTTGPAGEAHFAWRDFRPGMWQIFFGKTTGSGMGVVNNTNTTPIVTSNPLNPQIYVNNYGKIHIIFTINDGSSNYVMATSAASAGSDFEFTPTVISDTLTASPTLIRCDIAAVPVINSKAEKLVIVWTDFRSGESSGYGDIFRQLYLRESY